MGQRSAAMFWLFALLFAAKIATFVRTLVLTLAYAIRDADCLEAMHSLLCYTGL